VGGSIPLGQRLVDCRSDALGSVLNGHQIGDGRGNALRFWGPVAQPLICHAPDGFPPHLNRLLSRDFVPARSQSGLILGFTEAFPFARGLRECIMPGGFQVVVGDDFTKIGRHIDFRSPGLPGRVDRNGYVLSLSVLPAKAKVIKCCFQTHLALQRDVLPYLYPLENIFRIAIPRLVKSAQRRSPSSGAFTAPEIREARCSFPSTLASIWGIGGIKRILRRKKIEGRKQTFRVFRYR